LYNNAAVHTHSDVRAAAAAVITIRAVLLLHDNKSIVNKLPMLLTAVNHIPIVFFFVFFP